jgi:hypothetical protein
MGPSPVGDGENAWRKEHVDLPRASMGPSPVGDGENKQSHAADYYNVLQWGRRPSATERSPEQGR